MVFRVAILFCVAAVTGVQLSGTSEDGAVRVQRSFMQLPNDEGMMHNGWGDSIMNDEGEVNLHAVESTEDEPDSNSYPGEDEDVEKANDEVLRFKNGHRKPKIYRPVNQAVYSNDDLWK